MVEEHSEKKVLVACFSHAGENYRVGYITKGNTEIIAEMIAEKTSADLFRIETVKAYPEEYRRCTAIAKEEFLTVARPEIRGDIRVEDYHVIYLGYPIWCGQPPMAVFTFLEKHDWHGKTVIPFCTHEGSGLGSTEQNIKQICRGATLLKGLAVKGITAQDACEEAEAAVTEWLQHLNG